MDELGPLDIEFLINNPEVIAQARQVEATLQGVNESVQASATQASAAITNVVKAETASITKQIASTGDGIRIQIAQLKALSDLTPKTNLTAISAYNAKIQQLEGEVAKIANVGKKGFDEFGNAIGNNTNYLTTGYSWLRKIAQILPGIGVAGILGFATGPIFEYISGLDIFKNKLSQVRANLDALNEVQKDADKDAGKQTANLKILYNTATDVTQSTKERTAAAREIQKEFPDTFANSKILAILNGEESKSYQQLTKDIIKNAEARAAAAKIEGLSSQLLDADFEAQKIRNAQSNQALRSYISTQKEILSSANNTLSPAQAFQKAQISTSKVFADGTRGANGFIDAINKEAADALKVQESKKKLVQGQIDFLTATVGGDAALAKGIEKSTALSDLKKQQEAAKVLQEAQKQLLDTQISIQEKIKEFTSKNETKALTPDQSALTQVSDQFAAIVFQINQANGKYDAFVKKFGAKAITSYNADPNNKVKLSKTDPATLDAAENAAIDNQANLNENNYIQQDIDKKKKLYADYAAYRAKVGEDAANAEYADLLKSGRDFTSYLNNIEKAIPTGDNSGAIQQRKALVDKYQQENIESQKRSLEQLTIDYESYQQKRDAIIAVGQDSESKLREAGYNEAADQAKRDAEDKLIALDESHFKQMDSYKEFFDNVETLSTTSAKKQLAILYTQATAAFALGKISVKTYSDILKGLNGADDKLNNRLPAVLKALGSEFENMAQSVGVFDQALGKALSTVGSIISGVGSIKGNIDKLHSDKSSIGDKIGAGLGIISTVIGVFSAVYSLFDKSKAHAEQQQYYLQGEVKSIQAVNTELERQLEITKQLYGPERISGYLKQLDDIKAAQDDANASLTDKFALTGTNKQLDYEITEYNNGNRNPVIKQEVELYESLSKSIDLSKYSLNDLQNLLTEGKLDDKTAAIVQSLADLQQQAKDTQNALNADLTGTSFDDLTNSIVQMFQQGTTALNDFGANFQNVMQTAILNSFKRDYLENQLQEFYNHLAADVTAHGTLTADDIAKLQTEYNTILQNANTQFQALQKATGVSLTGTDATTSPNTLTGAIQGITADQADLLAGQFGGLRITQLQTNEILAKTQGDNLLELKNHTLLQMQIATNTARTANAAEGSLPILASIAKNTSGDSLTAAFRAAGKN